MPNQILKYYHFKLPQFSEQKFNKLIKSACMEAGINSPLEDITISSGNKSYESMPKWSLVTSHTAIKSFITMCVNKGLPPKDVDEMIGKSVAIITKHYYGINRSSIKSRMLNAFDISRNISTIQH